MNWERILKTNVSTLLRRFIPPHVSLARRGRVWRGPVYFFRQFWRMDLQAVTTQVDAIVRCNAPLVQGAEHAAWDAPSLKSRTILQALHDDIASGLMLHESMAQRTRFFPAYYVDLVKAGETTGRLRQAFEQIQEHLQAQRQRWFTIYGWACYLCGVAVLQLTVMLFLLAYVFPEFVETLSDFGSKPPAAFTLLTRIGNAIVFWFAPLPVLLIIAALLFPRQLLPFQRRVGDPGRSWLRSIGTYLPGLGPLLVKSELAHCAAVLKHLLGAGIPVNEALDDCADLDLSLRLTNALRRAKRRVEQGSSLSGAVAAERVFPESFRTQISIGEASGQLPAALERTSDLYRMQTARASRMALDIAGPLGVIALGLVVLTIEVSIFAMMTGIADGIAAGT